MEAAASGRLGSGIGQGLNSFSAATVAAALGRAGLMPEPPEALEKLASYGDLLLRWNQRMNLTAIRSVEGILERHLVESVAAAQRIPLGLGTLLDFGSGAGLPGIPIAIVRPDLKVMLAESQTKKAAFLQEVVRTLQLRAEVHAGRVDALGVSRKFEIVTLRAVDRMAEIVAEARARVEFGGCLMIFATDATTAVLLDAAAASSYESVKLPSIGSVLICKY